MNAPNPWAPKSAKDDEDDAVVAQARRLHVALHLAFLVLGLVAGFIVFQVSDNDLPLAVLEDLYGDEDSDSPLPEILLGALYMAIFGALAGEAGNAAWLLLCRYRLGLSADQVRAALDGRVVFSFVLRPLQQRLYAR
jgi:hypothetical protein